MEYKGKKVYIVLVNNREYTGVVYAVEKKEKCYLIKIKDKSGHLVGFYDTEIALIQEEEDN